MTRLLLPPGQPLAEAHRQAQSNRQTLPIPTGDGNAFSVWLPATTASATPQTKGAWVQVTAATAYDIYGLYFIATAASQSSTDTSTLTDIGVGAAGSEVVVVPNLAHGWNGSYGFRIPLFIPRGSRIAVRSQSAVVSKPSTSELIPLDRLLSARRPSTTVLALNVNEATSCGVGLANPGADNVWGAWTELVTSTPEPLTGLMAALQGGLDATQGGGSALVYEIAVGAAGSEVRLIKMIRGFTSAAEAVYSTDKGAWLVNLPKGVRLAGRWAAPAGVATSSLDVSLYGIR